MTTEIDLFFIDVKNGYLYAAYHDENKFQNRFVTLYYSGKIDKIRERQVKSFLPEMVKATKEILSTPEFYIKDSN